MEFSMKLLFGVLSLVCAVTSAPECTGQNEIFVKSRSACEPTCSTLYSETYCTAKVASGCFCEDGYVRDTNGDCIKIEDCYQDLCGPNEVRDCGSACDTTCATLGQECPIINIQCNNMCYCRIGYARDDCGRCIPIEKCPVLGCNGDLNAFNATCPYPCPATCESFLLGGGTAPARCRRLCVLYGCQCYDGLVQDETTGFNCVQPQDCHKCTGQFEQWSSNVDCTCDDINCEKTSKRRQLQEPGCHCIDGYVRDSNGICIQAGTCPHCPPLERFLQCGTACPATCDNLRLADTAGACVLMCVTGCFCNDGLVRDSNGRCINPRLCDAHY